MKKGFTLAEVIVVMSIFSVMTSAIAPVAYDSYASALFLSQEHLLISVLQKVRQESMNNVDSMPHGVHFESAEAILFEGQTFNSMSHQNQNYSFSFAITLFPQKDILFTELSGTTSDTFSATISDNKRQTTITVEPSGRINF